MFVGFAACRAEVLDGGSTGPTNDASAAESGQEDSEAGETGTGGGGSRVFGDNCENSSQCIEGLECLPFTVHPENEACKIVGYACSKRCASGAVDVCKALDPGGVCFEGCNSGEAVCGKTANPNAVTFTVQDDPAKLTTSAGDVLFTVSIVAITPVRPYLATNVEIAVEFVGEQGTMVNCTHSDTNHDGNVDVGETLHCTEPPVDKFNPSGVGKSASVLLLEKTGPSTSAVRGKSIWMAD